jgi:hypothetical protein
MTPTKADTLLNQAFSFFLEAQRTGAGKRVCPELEGSRPMYKLELVVLPFVYLLQMSSTLFLLFGLVLINICKYCFHTSENAALQADLVVWAQFFVCQLLYHVLNLVYTLLKLIVGFV